MSPAASSIVGTDRGSLKSVLCRCWSRHKGARQSRVSTSAEAQLMRSKQVQVAAREIEFREDKQRKLCWTAGSRVHAAEIGYVPSHTRGCGGVAEL